MHATYTKTQSQESLSLLISRTLGGRSCFHPIHSTNVGSRWRETRFPGGSNSLNQWIPRPQFGDPTVLSALHIPASHQQCVKEQLITFEKERANQEQRWKSYTVLTYEIRKKNREKTNWWRHPAVGQRPQYSVSVLQIGERHAVESRHCACLHC